MSTASDKARKLCAAATEGPWHVTGEHGDGVDNINDETICFVSNYRDVDFIAESRTLLAELAEQVEKLETASIIKRRTDEGYLAECPCCGSLDIGGASNTVSCYGCGLTITKQRPLQNAINAWNTRKGKLLKDIES